MKFHFEIDYPHEHAGWIDCYLNCDEQRYHLWASDVFPPFNSIVRFLQSIAVQRLPATFFWDEEGKGAIFEAWPAANDSPNFRFRVEHFPGDLPWVDAECNRLEIIHAFLDVLQDFVTNAAPPSRFSWNLEQSDLDGLTRLLTMPVPPRGGIPPEEPVQITIERSEGADSPSQWMTMRMWGIPLMYWHLEDTDPFWHQWFTFLEQVAGGEIPASVQLGCYHPQPSDESDDDSDPELVCTRRIMVLADVCESPSFFRLQVKRTDFMHTDFLSFDEILDRRQFLQAFCDVFDEFIHNTYQLYPDYFGKTFDLRTLPIDHLNESLRRMS